ncbi:MAG: hypothetical protein A3K67_01760 [Euryarchaeota archaeon RBG_16_62_10]|nr:MAG: hypothetical protein A3K67_01760 [Euryarchaeota archaeon RBG_16_62_10]
MVTVVGEAQCKKGFEFVFGGPIADCRDCKVKNVCFHLEQNRRYRVVEVRDVHHECRIHEGGVRVVEVERVPTRCALPARLAIEGGMITYEENDCKRIGCPHIRLCRPAGPAEGMRLRVASVEDEIECPKGEKLRIVLLD